MGAYRWAYNRTIQQKELEYRDTGKSGSYLKSRKLWIELFRKEAEWLKDIPAHTIYGAMMDADKDYSSVIKKRSKGLPTDLPRCRRRTQKTFYILGNAITEKGIYPRLLGLLKSKEKLPNKPRDSRILLENDKWYLLVPEDVECKPTENQSRIASVDPGIKTFATVFSQTELTKLGQGLFGRLQRLAYYLDDLLSRASKANKRRQKRMYLAAGRMRTKISNLVKDLHYQVIGYLFRNFDTVIFPEGDFTSACSKAKRKLRRKSVRNLLTFSFAKFRDRLISKAQLLGKRVVIVNEAYTSKTANWTGEIVRNLGGRSKITSNNITLDRDVNGALGIFLKALVDHPVGNYGNVNKN